MQQQKGHLIEDGWSQQSINEIESDHRDFLLYHRDDPGFKESIDAKAPETSDYYKLWDDCRSRYPRIQEFFGGLAVIYLTWPLLRPMFWVIRGEKDDYRESLGDFSLEGALKTKQFKVVSNIAD